MTPGPTDKPTQKPTIASPKPTTTQPPVAQPVGRLSAERPAPAVVHKATPAVPAKPAVPPKPKGPIEAVLGSKFDPKAHYRVVSPSEEARLLSITDPTTGDPETSPADSTGAKGAFTVVGAFDDGRKILQLTGTRPTA